MWHDRYGDEVEEYDAIVNGCGIGDIGSEETTEYDLPGAGPIGWDNDCDGDHTEMQFTTDEAGWYRVGARLGTSDGEHDFGWEAVDVKIVKGTDSEWEIDSQWKVSLRL
ncbi:hypothetical protein [Haladaptatus sp. DFWS20]|uniref:hypothetical protein n=1 Tax=Haladaptatus sp. DFWS20 TaxID=3403467 RepID=UPI003EBC8EAF